MNEELEVLKSIVDKLDKAGIPYMISGSMAANYYTVPRMTRDVDIVIELAKTDIDRFVKIFQDKFYVDADVLKTEVNNRGMFNLIHRDYVIKADFILRKPTDFQTSSFTRRNKVLIDNVSMLLISPEDLVVAKLIWAKDSHSELQLKDVANLLRTVPTMDKGYIKEWVKKLNLEHVYGKVPA